MARLMPQISPKGMGIFTMDFICLGSNGFAQVGQDDYHEKARVELVALRQYAARVHPVPEELHEIAAYHIKEFPHDFGWYKELVIVYDDVKLDALAESNEALVDRFWEWANEAESLELEEGEADYVVGCAWSNHLAKKLNRQPVNFPKYG
jgi:hypothetical protein